ncbi:MAG TPA: hypothetical protein VLT45_14130 [Kofleriaceae bacterium]|nr:hypothetical protein [Kofleriaceae bacterium]
MYAEGEEVTVSGIVRADDTIAAPLTGEYCVAHVTHARVWDQLDAFGQLVDDILIANLHPFTLETGGEPVHVAGGTFYVAIKPVDIYPRPAEGAALLRLRDLERYLRSTFFDHVLVKVGEWITVRGVVSREIDLEAERGYRETAVRTRLVGYAGRPLEVWR